MKSPLLWSAISLFLLCVSCYLYLTIENRVVKARFEKDWMPHQIALYFHEGNKVEFGYLNTLTGKVSLSGVLRVIDGRGRLRVQEYYENGLKNGQRIVYKLDNDGAIYKFLEQSYVNGEAHGLKRKYRHDGTLMLETKYSNGRENGVRKEWYSSGVLHKESEYKNGFHVSEVKVYREDGSLEMIMPLVDGTPSYEDRIMKP